PFFAHFAYRCNAFYLDASRRGRNIGVEAATGGRYQVGWDVFFFNAGVMYEKCIDARLYVLQVTGIGRPFVTTAAAGGIIVDGRRTSPEIIVFGKALSFEGITSYF